MDPRLITNLTQAGELDGVYIFEITPPGYISGQGNSIVGIAGEFERGPTDVVVDVGSTALMREIFGGYGTAPSGSESTWKGFSGYRAVAGKVWPSGLRIVRVSRTDMATATLVIDLDTHVGAGGKALTVNASSQGAWGNQIAVTIDDASDASLTNGFSLRIVRGGESEFIDNLFAAMSAPQLAEAAKNIKLVTLSIGALADTSKEAWPATASLATGSDGTAAALPWTNAIASLAARREVSIMFCAEPDGTTVTFAALNAAMKATIAPASGTTPFIRGVLSGPAGDDGPDTAEAAATYRSDRLIYTWPWREQQYSEASPVHPDGILLVPANSAVASALANIDPMYDPASSRGTRFINACTVGLEFEGITRDTYVLLNRAGVCCLEFDPDLGFKVLNGVTTSLRPGEENIHRRALADYFIKSLATGVKYYQNEPMTQDWKDNVRSSIASFLETEKALGRVESYEIDDISFNSPSTLSQGFYYVKIKIKTPQSARHIVLMPQIGPTVTVLELAA